MNLHAHSTPSTTPAPVASTAPVSGQADGRTPTRARSSLADVLRAFEARRKYPRVSMRLPIRIGLPGGGVVVASTHNMTPEGLQIRCDRKAASAINPVGHAVPRGVNTTLMVMMRLESPEEIHSCVLRCRWSYMSMTDSGDVAFGLEFAEPSAEQTRALDTVFAHALRPA